MPAYNCCAYIAEAVESVLGQTYQNWELLIADDGSIDNTFEIMKAYARQSDRVKVFCNGGNYGAAYTKNQLIRYSKGELIALMDADDVCNKDRLMDQFSFLKEKNLDACGTDYCTIDPSGNILEWFTNYHSYEAILWSAFHNFSFCNASLLIKRACLLNINGYDESLRTEAEDVEMLFRFLLSGHKIGTLSKYCYSYRLHDTNTSKTHSLGQKENSYNATRALLSNILDKPCSHEFARFMKYYHRSDYNNAGNCMSLFNDLRAVVAAIERTILKHRFLDPVVRLDVARKMLFLALNQRRYSKLKSLALLLETICYYPRFLKSAF